MATKTFKSEYHRGGLIIKATTNKNKVTFLICDNEYSFDTTNSEHWKKMDWLLFENTSGYYTEQILNWVKSKVN
jgi:hypothetical protein